VDFALGLRVGAEFSSAEMVVARKLGVTDVEISKLCSAIVDALRKGPMSPDEIRDATGKASRSLGPEGAKKGITTTVPLALGHLQSSGNIRRVPVNGRLDQQRYRYALWKPSPLEKFRLSVPESYVELARRYFRWICPATLAEFQWFSGLGVKAAKAAVEPLGLVPVENESERLMFADDRERFASFNVPSKPAYALVSSMDSLFLLRRNLSGLLSTEAAKGEGVRQQGSVRIGQPVGPEQQRDIGSRHDHRAVGI